MKIFLTMPILAVSVLAAGCASQYDSAITKSDSSPPMEVAASFLASANEPPELVSRKSSLQEGASGSESPSTHSTAPMQRIEPLGVPVVKRSMAPALAELFDSKGQLSIIAERMEVRDFIHYVFGELLDVNYILDPTLEAMAGSSTAVTLRLASKVTKRELFELTSELLAERNIQIEFGKGAFYIYSLDGSGRSGDVLLAIGRDPSDVPNTSQQILQVVPLKYGIKVSVQSSLVQLSNTLVTPNLDQNALIIKGDRAGVIRALELLEMLDVPAARGRFIGMINLSYISPEDFSDEVGELLLTEGLITGIGGGKDRNVVMVPLEKLGAVIVFAATQDLLDRVEYWATVVDSPGGGDDQQYFFYQPKLARAVDLGNSIISLISGGSSYIGGQSAGSVGSGESTGVAPDESRVSGVNSNKITLVVDERANALIFYATGSEYRALRPLLARLDVLPRQVALDIVIAEVTLKDEFKFGVEWALSRGEAILTTQGAFGAASIGGIGLVVNGKEGPFSANALSSNSLVKVLSNPTLTVRDGVSAQINVGSDISVIGATTQDPINGERQTTTSEYRKTGVDVIVTPTVNAKGIVVMEVAQTISNSMPNSSGASGNPDIFERSLSTEVVARSGQTIMLGGLISEGYNNGESATPLLGRVPLIGNFFKSNSNGINRTELVMLITPSVIEDLSQWQGVLSEFQRGVRYLELELSQDE